MNMHGKPTYLAWGKNGPEEQNAPIIHHSKKYGTTMQTWYPRELPDRLLKLQSWMDCLSKFSVSTVLCTTCASKSLRKDEN